MNIRPDGILLRGKFNVIISNLTENRVSKHKRIPELLANAITGYIALYILNFPHKLTDNLSMLYISRIHFQFPSQSDQNVNKQYLNYSNKPLILTESINQ